MEEEKVNVMEGEMEGKMEKRRGKRFKGGRREDEKMDREDSMFWEEKVKVV